MKILTATVNNPLFIEMQYHTLKKYMKNDYEFIVFNDAKEFPDFTNDGNINIKKEIENKCKELNIKCINLNNDNHKQITCPAIRCAMSMNEMHKYYLSNPDKYLIIDSDMFLIDYFDINKYENYKSAILLQERDYNNSKIKYLWNGIVYLDTTINNNLNLINWNLIYGLTDVGGYTYEWLNTQIKENERIPETEEIRYNKENIYNTSNIYFIKHLWSLSWDNSEMPENLKDKTDLISFISTDPRNKNNKYYCEIYDNCFLHYRNGGNWLKEGLNFHNDLTKKLYNSILRC